MNSSGDALHIALQRAERLQKELVRRERQIGALRRACEALSLRGGDQLIGQALDVALEALGARAGALLLYDAADDCLVFRCVLGPCAESLSGKRLPAAQGIAGQVLRTGIADVTRYAAPQTGFHFLLCPPQPVEEDQADSNQDEKNRENENEILLTAPLLRASGDAIGVMQLLWSEGAGGRENLDHSDFESDFELDRSDLEVVQVFCASVVAALEAARLAGQAHRAEIVSIIGDISHDIKNMLTPIQSGLWTLEPMLDHLFEGLEVIQQQSRGRAAESEIARIAEILRGDYGWIMQSAHTACDQITARTREIADAVKGELAAPVFAVANLNDVVSDVARPLFMLADQTNVHLHLDLDRALPHAEFDRKQIYNAVYNLVNNAIPETPSGGNVTIRTRAPNPGEDTLLLEVEDTGRGVPEHVLALLFSDQAVSTKPGGTGLGTRIVGGVVRRHQGQIAVRSEAGQGTTFSIRLPLRQRPEAAFGTPSPGPLPVRRHNLPAAATSFVGRETELSRARKTLQSDGARLLTLTGAGGTGKTRLALQVATAMVESFEDGVWQVALAPIEDAERVAAAIAAILGVREESGRGLESSLTAFLRSKHLMLLLDNFEQVLGAAPLVSRLLEECAGLKILITSRSALNLRSERELPVAPLELPAPISHFHDLSPAKVRELAGCESVALFVERAAQVRADFALSPANARDVASICTRLDGLPLAIELAAARVKILSPGAILTHLENHLSLPGSGPQDAPRRHQTLRAAIDWSYNSLSPPEQILLRRLAVFEGGCSPEAAGVVAGVEEIRLEAPLGLQQLCDKSLLRSAPQSDGSTWFFALETLRQYGREKLVASGELERVRRRHAAYYLAIAEAAQGLLTKAPDAPPAPQGLPASDASQILWREWREREYQNLRAALNWFLEHTDQPGTDGGSDADDAVLAHGALRMALALRQVWVGNLWTERREALERALEQNPGAPPEKRLQAMLYAGDLAALQGDTERAKEFGQSSFALSRESGNDWGKARALGILGNSALENGDFARAIALHQESLALYRAMGHRGAAPWALYFLGAASKRAGDETASRGYFEQSLAEFRELEDKEGIAMALYQLGMALHQRDDPAPSRAMIEESLAIFTALSHQSGTAWTLAFLGQIAAGEGDYKSARARLEQSLEVSRRLGSRADVSAMLTSLSEIALQEGDWEQARAFLRELLVESSASHKTSENTSPAPDVLRGFARLAAGQGQIERAALLCGALRQNTAQDFVFIARMRENLGEVAFDAAYGRGAALVPAEISREVLAV